MNRDAIQGKGASTTGNSAFLPGVGSALENTQSLAIVLFFYTKIEPICISYSDAQTTNTGACGEGGGGGAFTTFGNRPCVVLTSLVYVG